MFEKKITCKIIGGYTLVSVNGNTPSIPKTVGELRVALDYAQEQLEKEKRKHEKVIEELASKKIAEWRDDYLILKGELSAVDLLIGKLNINK